MVPQVVYPEAFNTSNTTALDDLLTKKLRRCALDLRALYAAEALSHGCKQSPLPQNVHESVVERVRALKMDQVRRIAIAPSDPDLTKVTDRRGVQDLGHCLWYATSTRRDVHV